MVPEKERLYGFPKAVSMDFSSESCPEEESKMEK